MPKAAKRFASQRSRSVALSGHPATARLREIVRSRIGFAVEEQCIKTKYRTRLARAKKALKSSAEWINGSAFDRKCMEAQCREIYEVDKLRELESAAEEWLKIVEGGETMQIESDIEEEENDEEKEDGITEYKEWHGIQDDVDLDKSDEEIENHGSEEWETEEDGDDGDDNDDFEESPIDVSDNEILYDKDGNIMAEEDLGEGLKEIMEYHMSKLRKRLDMFAILASTKDKDEDE